MKYNDYIYGFTVNQVQIFNVSTRIDFTSEVQPSQIHELLCKDAVKKAKQVGVNLLESNVCFSYISLVYSGEIK